MPLSHILFDLDGTLTDPKLGITKSIQYALSKFDIQVEDLDTLDPFIGPPLGVSFQEIYAFSELETKKAIEYYREYFADRGLYENEVYAGIPQLLEQLQGLGVALHVATSKPTVFAEKILKHFKLDGYFDFVCGSNLDGTRSDKAEIISHVLEMRAIHKSSTIMIGDRKHDIIGAQKNSIASVGVGFGYGSDEELQLAAPSYLAGTVSELGELLVGMVGVARRG